MVYYYYTCVAGVPVRHVMSDGEGFIIIMVISLQVFQYDMWGVTPSPLHDWADLKSRVARHGVRNSLLLAPMPTASTAQILGNNESIEAYTSNIYTRRQGGYCNVNDESIEANTSNSYTRRQGAIVMLMTRASSPTPATATHAGRGLL